MSNSKPLPDLNLVDSLKNDAGWEIYNFGYNGANPPYVRIGATGLLTLRVEPVFELFIRDKFLFRSKVSIEKHLRSYDWIKINPIVFEESFGRKFSTEETFPFNQWLRLGRMDIVDIHVLSNCSVLLGALPLPALSISVGVWLKRDV